MWGGVLSTAVDQSINPSAVVRSSRTVCDSVVMKDPVCVIVGEESEHET